MTTLQILEDYLDGFPGIVITVSHDRYFLDRIVRRIFAFEKGGVLKQYEGGYTDYAIRRDEILAAEANRPEGSAVPSRSDADKNAEGSSSANWRSDRKRKLKFSYQEQKDYETIESEIEAIEEKIAKLDQDYLKHSSDFIKLGQIAKEKEEAEALLEQKMDRWAYLEDLAIRIENGEYV